jgi:hypothetical protein
MILVGMMYERETSERTLSQFDDQKWLDQHTKTQREGPRNTSASQAGQAHLGCSRVGGEGTSDGKLTLISSALAFSSTSRIA